MWIHKKKLDHKKTTRCHHRSECSSMGWAGTGKGPAMTLTVEVSVAGFHSSMKSGIHWRPGRMFSQSALQYKYESHFIGLPVQIQPL